MRRRDLVVGSVVFGGSAAAQTLVGGSGTVTSSANITSTDLFIGADEVPRVVCDKCGSGDIEYREKYPPKPKDVKLSEWVRRSRVTTTLAIYRTTQYVAECRKCRFSVEYSQ